MVFMQLPEKVRKLIESLKNEAYGCARGVGMVFSCQMTTELVNLACQAQPPQPAVTCCTRGDGWV